MKNLALIPARGGSKSIPLKNMYPLNGYPLIYYVCKTALLSKEIDKVCVSTDSQEIIDYVKSNFKKIEISKRPESLSLDDTPVIDVINFTLKEYAFKNIRYETVSLLQPTSPFLKYDVLDQLISKLNKSNSHNSIQTVFKIPHNYHAYNQRFIDKKNNKIDFVFKKERLKMFNKQTKPIFYKFSNCVVTKLYQEESIENIFAEPSMPYIIEDYLQSIDVDNLFDFKLAESLLNLNK